MIDKSVINFGMVGTVSTLVDFAALNFILLINPNLLVLATSLGYVVGFFTGYTLNSRWTFKASLGLQSLTKFTMMNIGSLVFTNIIVVNGVGYGWNHNVVKIVAVITIFFWNYTVSKYWVFKHEQDQI